MSGTIGLMPVSTALAGAIVKLGPTALFAGAGAGLLLVSAAAAAGHRGWSLDALEAAGEDGLAAEAA